MAVLANCHRLIEEEIVLANCHRLIEEETVCDEQRSHSGDI